MGTDANGNSLRLAIKTGHVSNYDESKVGHYTLPDPLVLANGKPVLDAKTWEAQRRPEILRMYETEIYGRIPSGAPRVLWRVAETSTQSTPGALTKRIVGGIGDAAHAPQIHLSLYTPANAKSPVPVVLMVNFHSNDSPPQNGSDAAQTEAAVTGDILSRGWDVATVGYQDVQPDRADSLNEGVIGLTSAAMHRQPGPDEWGAISAWAWGISRILDYLQTDKFVDPKHIAGFGHSRLGKTVLWASALDQRIAAVYASCPGEMGAALSRRDFGETVDDMAQNFPYWFAGNFQKWVGHWNDMPVDAHMLIALSAPRPVFITGGSKDQWADPRGEFLAEVAAGPVYRLLGKKDLGTDQLPALDTPLISGDLGWYYHTGPHAATAEDWKVFLDFLGKYFR